MNTQPRKLITLLLFSLIFLAHPNHAANDGATNHSLPTEETGPKRQSLTYHPTNTAIWAIGAAFIPPPRGPLRYYFFPFTYTYQVNEQVTYSQFVMYRYESYYEEPLHPWHNLHELYLLPGLRLKPDVSTPYGYYYALHTGFSGGRGTNFSFFALNLMPEIGYTHKPFAGRFFCSWSLGLLITANLHQDPVYHIWHRVSMIGVLAHMVTPILGVNIGIEF